MHAKDMLLPSKQACMACVLFCLVCVCGAHLNVTPVLRQALTNLSLTSLAELLTGKNLLSAASMASGIPMCSGFSSLYNTKGAVSIRHPHKEQKQGRIEARF